MEPDVPTRALTEKTAPEIPAAPEAGPSPPAEVVEPAPAAEAGASSRARSRPREYAEAILVAIIFALFARTFLFQAFQVPTASMEKNILVGDHLIVNKFIFAPHHDGFGFLSRLLPYRPVRRGDVLVFKFPEDPRRDFVKRTIALPGYEIISTPSRSRPERNALRASDGVMPGTATRKSTKLVRARSGSLQRSPPITR